MTRGEQILRIVRRDGPVSVADITERIYGERQHSGKRVVTKQLSLLNIRGYIRKTDDGLYEETKK